jgi:hypothetical protein
MFGPHRPSRSKPHSCTPTTTGVSIAMYRRRYDQLLPTTPTAVHFTKCISLSLPQQNWPLHIPHPATHDSIIPPSPTAHHTVSAMRHTPPEAHTRRFRATPVRRPAPHCSHHKILKYQSSLTFANKSTVSLRFHPPLNTQSKSSTSASSSSSRHRPVTNAIHRTDSLSAPDQTPPSDPISFWRQEFRS